jgi:DNA (cytosine-5)-methyltransferase 1
LSGVRRHRLFESDHLFALLPSCDHSKPIAGVYGHPHGRHGAWAGMLPSTAETWAAAMGIDWMTPGELSQAIPPAYTEFIGRQLLQCL